MLADISSVDAIYIVCGRTDMRKSIDGLCAIIQEQLIPALDVVGKGFEKGTIFLPQLLMSAEAAKEAFAVLNETAGTCGQNRYQYAEPFQD